jgi:hypothetical protein
MKEVCSILFGAAFTVAVSIALGSLLLRVLRVGLYRFEALLFQFIAGSGVLSLLVTMLCLVQQARTVWFLSGGIAAIAAAILASRRQRTRRRSLPAIGLDWLIPFALLFSAFFIYYFFNALAPEVSPDGSGYHLGNVTRTWQHHGFDWEYRSMYSYLSQGAEMLYLFAFSFGGLSSAALVHFTFLCVLPLLLVCYGRRFGFPKAGLFAALVVFVSPIVAKDGVSAYNDLCLVTLIYAVFYLLQVWDQSRSSNLLILIGLISGYAYAVKYTALLTLPFAVAWVWWRNGPRIATLARLAIPAAVLIFPWVVRNWIWAGNPVAPFANAWFPNPYYHTGMERQYVELLSHYFGIKHWWQIPLEATLRGSLTSGTLNPVILMLPLSLLTLATSQGRRLLLAALIFAVPAWFNTGARFLIPSLPFAALALGIALQGIPFALPAAGLFTALVGWPGVLSAYCDPWNWRISTFPEAQALRKESVEPYILKSLPDYALKPVLESNVPPGEPVFSFAGRPNAYLDRDIIVSYESSLGNLVQDIFWAPEGHPPRIRMKLRFLPVTVRKIRVVNSTTNPNYWTVAEMRVFSQGKELVRDGRWRVSGWPNAWEAPLAFDNSYATRWSTWEAMEPGAYLEIEFPSPERIDEVVLECDPAWQAKVEVDALLSSGKWVGMTDTAEFVKAEPPPGIRRAAASEVRALGFKYVLVNEDDYVYQDLKKNLRFWGMTQLAVVNGTHFYRID